MGKITMSGEDAMNSLIATGGNIPCGIHIARVTSDDVSSDNPVFLDIVRSTNTNIGSRYKVSLVNHPNAGP
eukprot:gene19206-20291_t